MNHRAVTVTENLPRPYGQRITVGSHVLGADEPKDVGGQDSGATPYELVMAGLGACTNMTLKMYAMKKGWALTGISTMVTHEKVEEDGRKVDVFARKIRVEGRLDEEQRARLLDIADKCPVSRTLENTCLMMPAAAGS